MITNRVLLKRISMVLVSLVLLGALATIVMAAISQTPLYLGTAIKPNIAILLDNSGSMWNMMYHPNFPTNEENASWNNKKFEDEKDYQLLRRTYSPYRYYLKELNVNNTFNGDSSQNFTFDGVTIKLPKSSDPNDTDTRYSGAYLNWLFYGASEQDRTDVATKVQYQKTRLRAAKDSIKSLISGSYNSSTNSYPYRWGVFTYTYDPNASAPPTLGKCSDTESDISTMLTNIENLQPSMNTPLGNSLMALWNYFKDTSSGPITNNCQKNFVIAVTDGYPYIPNQGTGKNYYDSYGSDAKNASGSDDDYWYNPDFPADNWYRSKAHIVTKRMHTEPARTDMPASTIDTFVIGLAFGQQDAENADLLLNKMTGNSGGQSFGASSTSSLSAALNSIIGSIVSRLSSASAVTVNTAFLTSNTKLFRTKFDSVDWSGFLEAYKLNRTDGSLIGYPNSPNWEAGALLEGNSSRNIYTAGNLSGSYKRLDFSTSNYSSVVSAGLALASDNNAQNLISYIRGDSTPSGYRYRPRKLGDMIYSAPVISGPPVGYYTDNNYQSFKRSNASRASLLVVGANDGMLHAFDAETGNEKWAFIPNYLLPDLKHLTVTPYAHRNYVDGTPTIGDAYIASKNTSGNQISAAWRTILVCGLREGGKSYFALDITDPDSPVPLWEITPSSPSPPVNGPNGLGYSFGAPLILKLKDKTQTDKFRWVVVLPNGYQGTTSGKSASLIIADLATGDILREIVVDSSTFTVSSANGLSSPSAVDINGDNFADFIYAGDLKGHLWKFNVSSDTISDWDVSYKGKTGTPKPPVPLFFATDAGNNPQPITTAPDIVLRGGFQIVYFGTGKYFETGDQAITQSQSFYGLYDYNISDNDPLLTGKYSKTNLVQQNIVEEITYSVNGVTNGYRFISNETVSPNPSSSTQLGWFLNLPSTGERVITDPVAHAGKIIFTTFIPNTDPCSFGGKSWLMELDLNTGGIVDKPVFDVNGDGRVDDNDLINKVVGPEIVREPPGGLSLGDGGASSPTIVGSNDDGEKKYVTKTNGEIIKVVEGGGTSKLGMRSWRQLR